MFQHIYDEFFATPELSWAEKYAREITIAVGITIACGGGIWYFLRQKAQFNQKATAALFETLQEYQDAEQARGETTFNDVQAATESGATQFAGSIVSGYFSAVQSDVAARQSDLINAQQFAQKAVDSVGSTDPLYDVYAIKVARMQLENEDATEQEKGRLALVGFAQNNSSNYQDMAQYYLGKWYAQNGKIQEAKKVLEDLVVAQEQFEGKPEYSPWAHPARELLEQVA